MVNVSTNCDASLSDFPHPFSHSPRTGMGPTDIRLLQSVLVVRVRITDRSR